MKRLLMIAFILAAFGLAQPASSQVRIHVGIGIGFPFIPRVIVAAPAPVIVAPAAPVVAVAPVVAIAPPPIYVGAAIRPYGYPYYGRRMVVVHARRRW